MGWSQELQRWVDPLAANVLGGRVPQIGLADGYGRLPGTMQERVRESVWHLGQDAAGVYIDFYTDSEHLEVAYQVTKNLSMPHMPTTGVSGVDLYANDVESGQWYWIHGRYDFADTIRYTFSDFPASQSRQYRLYLPLYNTVEWMKIGLDSGSRLDYIKPQNRPIVIYGTSIAQGACASRPGLAWTNWLGRFTDREVINLGFSGNGRLEPELLHFIKSIDASVFILDCIPNLSVEGPGGEEHLAELIEQAVCIIREEHAQVPIVFAAHSSSGVEGVLNNKPMADFDARSRVAEQTVEKLVREGDPFVYWLGAREMGLDSNSTVDYAHPNDYGMKKIAEAYKRLLIKLKALD